MHSNLPLNTLTRWTAQGLDFVYQKSPSMNDSAQGPLKCLDDLAKLKVFVLSADRHVDQWGSLKNDDSCGGAYIGELYQACSAKLGLVGTWLYAHRSLQRGE